MSDRSTWDCRNLCCRATCRVDRAVSAPPAASGEPSQTFTPPDCALRASAVRRRADHPSGTGSSDACAAAEHAALRAVATAAGLRHHAGPALCLGGPAGAVDELRARRAGCISGLVDASPRAKSGPLGTPAATQSVAHHAVAAWCQGRWGAAGRQLAERAFRKSAHRPLSRRHHNIRRWPYPREQRAGVRRRTALWVQTGRWRRLRGGKQ
jgi:hypothetical protein